MDTIMTTSQTTNLDYIHYTIDILPKGIGNISSVCNYHVYRLLSVNHAHCFLP